MYSALFCILWEVKYYMERMLKDKEMEWKWLVAAKKIKGKVIERMKKRERGCCCCILSVFSASVSQQKLCVQDYKHTIIPVFITAHITVCLCPTYCNGVVWFDGCLRRGFLSIAPIIPLSASPHCRNVCLHIQHSLRAWWLRLWPM